MKKTYLHLENGERFEGESFGFEGESRGEVVFSTGMTGYVESLTDPSFSGQILTFTYPLIGNYGVPKPIILDKHLRGNWESEKIWVKGVVVGQNCQVPSHSNYYQTLSEWMMQEQIPGISNLDTRVLTQLLRDQGVMRGVISKNEKVDFPKTETAVNYVKSASCSEKIVYKGNGPRVVLIDCGVKHGILRALIANGYEVVRIPWDANPLDIENIDGVVCSNGPGDPKDLPITVANIQKVIKAGLPYLGICLGHQMLALSIGADTYKLKYGHRGLNQPCLDVINNKAYVTSQNHGYAARKETIPSGYEEWFINLNDNTNEGIRHKTKNIQSVQFHPEGEPGPFDTKWIFKCFV